MLENLHLSDLIIQKTDAIYMKMDGSRLDEKSSCKILELFFVSQLDWCHYIPSVAKIARDKTRALIRSIKFLSSEAVLYLHKSHIRPCLD